MDNEQEIKREIQLLNLQKIRLKNLKTIINLEDDSADKANRLLKINGMLRRNYSDLMRAKSNLNIKDAEALSILTEHKKQIGNLLNLNNTLNSDLSKQLKIKETITNIDKIQSIGAHLINVSSGKNRDIRLEIQDIGQGIVENQKSIIENDADNLDISEQLLNTEKLRQKILDTYGNKNKILVEHLLDELGTRGEILKSQQLEVDILKRRNELIGAGVEQIESMFDSIQSGLNNIPGGNLLSRVIGLDSFKSTFTNTIKDNLTKGESAFKGLGLVVSKSFGVIGKALTSTLGSVLGIVAIFGILYGVLSGMTEKIVEITKELGISTSQSKQLVKNSKEWAGQLTGGLATSDDILAAQSAIVKEYGTTNNISKELVDNITIMEHAFGVAGETTAKVTKSLQGMGISKNAIATANILAGGLAEAAGVPIGEVMEDVAQSSEMIHKYLPKYAPDIYKAAIEAKRLGLSLSEVGKVGDQLIDIQSNLEKEMTAQVLLGRKLDFDHSRELFANKKPMEAIGVLMKDIGDINKVNMFQQQAITEATGLTVDQMAEYQRKQIEINDLHGTELDRYNAANLALEELNKGKEKSIVEQQEANLQTERMKATWDATKQSLIKAIQPLAETLLPILRLVGNGLQFIAEHTYIIQALFIALGTLWVAKLLDPIFGTISALKKLGGLAKSVFSKKIMADKAAAVGGSVFDEKAGRFRDKLSGRFTKAPKTPEATGGGKPSKIMEGFSKIDWKQLLGAAAVMLAFAAAMWILSYAFENFAKLSWENLSKGMLVMILFAMIMIKIGTVLTVASPILWVAAAVMVAFAVSLWIISQAMKGFAEAAVIMIPVFEVVFAGIKAIIDSLATGFVAIINSAVGGLVQLSNLGPGLLLASTGIMAIAGAMALFAGGSLLGAIGSVLSEVGVVKTLSKLSDMAPGLNSVAESLNSIKASMDGLNGTKADISLSTNKAETIGTEGQKVTPQVQNIPVTTTTNTGTDGLGRIVILIEQLIGAVNQPQVIHIGNKVINEIGRQQNLKRHLAVGLDNSYGYTI